MGCFHCAKDVAALIHEPNEEKRTISVSPCTAGWPWSFKLSGSSILVTETQMEGRKGRWVFSKLLFSHVEIISGNIKKKLLLTRNKITPILHVVVPRRHWCSEQRICPSSSNFFLLFCLFLASLEAEAATCLRSGILKFRLKCEGINGIVTVMVTAVLPQHVNISD